MRPASKFSVMILLLFAPLLAWGGEKRVCLNMIVKDESRAIRDCLESVKGVIDEWVIVDTGSTDGTQEIIREVLRGIPGELFERPWVNFEHNRNEALRLGRGDYLLFIDADERLSMSGSFPELNKDCYFIRVREPNSEHKRLFLVDLSLPWRWEGVVHETLICEEAKSGALLEEAVLISNTVEGARSSDPEKYLKDARLLEEALIRDPTNSRSVFYLAQSYWNAGELDLAKNAFLKRSQMGGWDEEVFWSLYQAGNLTEALGGDGRGLYEKAFLFRPIRAEPLYRLANRCLSEGKNFEAYTLSKLGLSIPMPGDHVFVEEWIYRFGFLLSLAHAAYSLQLYQEAYRVCQTLLSQDCLPEQIRATVQNNLQILLKL